MLNINLLFQGLEEFAFIHVMYFVRNDINHFGLLTKKDIVRALAFFYFNVF